MTTRDGERGDPTPSDHDVAWATLTDVLTAAFRGDAERFHMTLLAMDLLGVDDRWRCATYLDYLLRRRLLDIFGRKPTEAELAALRDEVFDRYSRLIRPGEESLGPTLRSAFRYTNPEPIDETVYVITAPASLGSLLDSVEPWLAEHRGKARIWFERSESVDRAKGQA